MVVVECGVYSEKRLMLVAQQGNGLNLDDRQYLVFRPVLSYSMNRLYSISKQGFSRSDAGIIPKGGSELICPRSASTAFSV